MRKFFIGLVPTKEIVNTITSTFPDLKTEPHITLRAPVDIPEDPSWLPRVEQSLRDVRQFSVSIGHPTWFPTRSVLHLPAQAPGIFQLHHKLMQVLPIADANDREKYHQGEFFEHPHLTLHYAKNSQDAQAAEALAHQLDIPISFQAQIVRVYAKNPGERYRRIADIPLNSVVI